MKIEPVYKKMGRRIAEARGDLGLTQESLAKRLKLTRASIVNIEHGRQRVMIHTLVKLSSLLGVSYDWLIEGIPNG